jgi:hypothetical protein
MRSVSALASFDARLAAAARAGGLAVYPLVDAAGRR